MSTLKMKHTIIVNIENEIKKRKMPKKGGCGVGLADKKIYKNYIF